MMNSAKAPSTVIIDSFYLPPVALLRHLHSAASILINTEVKFAKSGWHNRCKIAGPNGPLLLTVPVTGGRGIKKPLKEVCISYEERWQQVHWGSICAAYRKSSYFEFYEYLFRPYYEQRFDLLTELNDGLLKAVLQALTFKGSINQANLVEATIVAGIEDVAMNTAIILNQRPYHQVFQHRHGFLPGLSIIDLIFNEGPAARAYLSADAQ